MESAQSTLITDKLEIPRIVVYTTINKLERKTERIYVRGFGDTAEFTNRDMGWFMHLTGSKEWIHIGFDDPGFKPGQKLKVTFEVI